MKFLVTLFFLIAAALAVDIPILLDGALIDATATDDSYNTGGTITVNGWTVNVPKNMLVSFPAAFVPWREFVANKSAVLGFEVNVCPPPLPVPRPISYCSTCNRREILKKMTDGTG